MGLLSKGTPLDWEASKPFHRHVKRLGIQQFLRTFDALKDRTNDHFLWGDEIEYMVLQFDDQMRTVKVALRGETIISEISKTQSEMDLKLVTMQPEYARFMVEATPGRPYGDRVSDLMLVEHNMVLRRKIIQLGLEADERIMSITSFPLLGSGCFMTPWSVPSLDSAVSKSQFLSDALINSHPRFACLTRNIRERRGNKVCITVPMFKDQCTLERFDERTENLMKASEITESKHSQWDPFLSLRKDSLSHIYMDSMGFGMGCCCLQVTFQARSLEESRYLYDQLAVLAPIMLALTASSPIWKGNLSDIDVRWTVISQSVDDRTETELDPIEGIAKSRYDSISTYISNNTYFKAEYNDLDIQCDPESLSALTSHGVDSLLARHISHLFIRDPLVVFKETLDADDLSHFENIQSTNWQSVRFKPPPANTSTGWRVEFRTMEVQPSDFENAAFTVFITLVSRAILFFQLDLYIPVSKVDCNMSKAHSRDAVHRERFFFRDCIQPGTVDTGISEVSLDEIINGRDDDFPGVIGIVEAYLNVIECNGTVRSKVDKYLDLISGRASGRLWNWAKWTRDKVRSHEKYAFNSKVDQNICYDILNEMHSISIGETHCSRLFGDIHLTH